MTSPTTVRPKCPNCEIMFDFELDPDPVAQRLLEAAKMIFLLLPEYADYDADTAEKQVYDDLMKAITEAESQLGQPRKLEFEIRSTMAMDAMYPEWTHLSVKVGGHWFTQVFPKDAASRVAHAIAESLGMEADIKKG